MRPTEKAIVNNFVPSQITTADVVYQVAAFPPVEAVASDGRNYIDGGWISIQVLRGGCVDDTHTLRNRIKRAWRVLWGCPDTMVEIEIKEDVAPIIEALRQAKEIAFPYKEEINDQGAL